jgi:hypothetical protein
VKPKIESGGTEEKAISLDDALPCTNHWAFIIRGIHPSAKSINSAIDPHPSASSARRIALSCFQLVCQVALIRLIRTVGPTRKGCNTSATVYIRRSGVLFSLSGTGCHGNAARGRRHGNINSRPGRVPRSGWGDFFSRWLHVSASLIGQALKTEATVCRGQRAACSSPFFSPAGGGSHRKSIGVATRPGARPLDVRRKKWRL